MSDKNFPQDVIPPAQKRSIRNIPIPKHRHPKGHEDMDMTMAENAHEEDADMDDEGMEMEPPQEPPHRRHRTSRASHRPKKSRKLYYIIGAVIVVLFFIVNMFHSADVVVTPHTEKVSVDTVLRIGDPEKDDTSQDMLPYRTIEVSSEASEQLKASGEEEVEVKAKGTIIVYNDYSESDQPLVKQTRFQTEDGKIYRIQESIVVPGQTASGPGSIEVEVVADEAGDEYNIDLTDFTIPGFKDLPQYDGFYARSKTVMTGGFSGVRKVVSASDRQQAEETLSNQLKADLVAMAESELGDNFILIPSSNDYIFESSEESDGDGVLFKMKGTLSVKVFNTNLIADLLAKESIPTFTGNSKVDIADPSSLTFTLSGDEALQITGNAHIIWIVNPELLRNKLVDQSKSDVTAILKEFSEIDKAKIDIKPFWKRSFPDSPDNITIEESNPLE